MVRVVLVGFLPDDHGRSCEAHPYGCGNALIEGEGNGVGCVVRLRLVEKVHLACYVVKFDRTDGCRICFVAREYGAVDMNMAGNGVKYSTKKYNK